MQVHRQLSVITFLLLVIVPAAAGVPSADRRERLRLLRTQDAQPMNLDRLERAYLDVFSILRQPNSCGEFFGGSAAQTPLIELVVRLRETRMSDTRVGVRMSGRFSVFAISGTEFSYRLFDHTELNTAGPFYKAKAFPADPFVPRVGSFQPNTRAVRALMLFHELAHLIQGANGAWLIPDDGESSELSRENNRTIEARCGEQIRAL